MAGGGHVALSSHNYPLPSDSQEGSETGAGVIRVGGELEDRQIGGFVVSSFQAGIDLRVDND